MIFVSTHSRLKAAGFIGVLFAGGYAVSTHSRLKAAGLARKSLDERYTGFNTQPPEGGWRHHLVRPSLLWLRVSTHSRLKAAGCARCLICLPRMKFQHTAA